MIVEEPEKELCWKLEEGVSRGRPDCSSHREKVVIQESPAPDTGVGEVGDRYTVFDLFEEGNLERVVRGEDLGTRITSGG